MTRFYRKEDIADRYKPGLDVVPYYSEGRSGIHCNKCGQDFQGIHVCQVK